MKNYLFTLLVLIIMAFFAMPVLAEEMTDDEKYEDCAGYEETTAAVMSARQNGLPFSEAIAIAREHDMYTGTIKIAYDVEIQSTEEGRKNIVRLWAEESYKACLEHYGL